MIYVDSSALVKLVIDEEGSEQLRDFTSHRRLTSSALVITEVPRAVGRADVSRIPKATSLLDHVQRIAIVESVLDSAARLGPPGLRSLDAIHLASALLLGDELEAFVAYDERLLAAASALGMPVAAPGTDLLA